MALSVEEQAAGAVDVILQDGGTLRLRAPARGDAGALLAFFDGLSERSLYLRFHGIRQVDRRSSSRILEPDWAERGAPRPGWLGDARRRAWRTTPGCATRARPRSPSSSPTTSRAAGSARACSSSSPLARPRPASTRFVAEVMAENHGDARRLHRRRLRGRRASSSTARSRSASRSRRPRRFAGARRGARPRRRRRLAAAVLRAGERRRDRRLAPARLDRRRALPQRARSRLRRRRLSGQPRRRAGRRRARLRLDRRDPRPGRARRDLRSRAGACSRRPRRRSPRACARSA